MANSFVEGDRVVHINKTTVGGPEATDTQVMAVGELPGAFAARVSEMATLCAAARVCRDSTAMTAIQTRINAIDD